MFLKRDSQYTSQSVRFFIDTKPNGDTFSYEDPYVEGGLHVHTEYDQDGKLVGLRAE